MNTYITIPGFSQMTAQQVLEKSVRHVAANGRPSIDPAKPTRCQYGGIGCAAAPFIRPEARAWVENQTWLKLTRTGFAPHEHGTLVSALQSAHDTAALDHPQDPQKFLSKFFCNVRRRVSGEVDLSFIDALEKGGVR